MTLKWYRISTKYSVCSRTEDVIIQLALRSGFVLEYKENYNFLTEFRRSIPFRLLLKKDSVAERIAARIIGRLLHYIRTFKSTVVS